MGTLFPGQRRLLGILLIPGVVYVVVWRIVPAFYTVYLSFTSYNLAFDRAPTWAGLDNYFRLFGDPKFLNSLWITLKFSISATFLELSVGLGVAILLDRRLPARNVILGICLLPMVLAPVAVATMWYMLFHNFVGPIPHLIELANGPEIRWLSSKGTALLAIIIADVWEWTPLMMLLLLAALQGVARDTVEAAMVDGASGVQVFRFVTLPQITGMVAVAIGLRFMDAFLELDKVMVMTGGGPGTSTELVGVHIYRTAFEFFTLGYAAAIVVFVLIGLAGVYRLYMRALPIPGLFVSSRSASREP